MFHVENILHIYQKCISLQNNLKYWHYCNCHTTRFIMRNNHTKSDNNVATPFLRKAAVSFLIIVSILCAGFTTLYVVYDFKPGRCLMYLLTVQHLIWLAGVLIYKKIPLEPVIMFYLSYILISLYPFVCMYWNSGDPVMFFWYVLIIIGVITFKIPNIELWIILTLGIVVSVFFFSSLFPQESLTPTLISNANILTVISTIILASFFAIVYVKRNNIDESMLEETLRATTKSVENSDRDKALYNDIIYYLENNKPFKDPNFSAYTLAKALNTNVNYISKAISAGDSDNFNTLLNSFRINYIKSMLDSGALKKYTIDYIYTEAGYKHRSTFNTAFKSITGMTPSDYASQQQLHTDCNS